MVDWPHAPPHRFVDGGLHFLTARTYHAEQIYRDTESLDRLQDRLFQLAATHGVTLQAWALMSNHYHLVAAPQSGASLGTMLRQLHSLEAIERNERDATPGRKVWYQFRDTLLTFERSWMARLRYTHENPVHHLLVTDATDYRWCSAGWFARTAPPAFARTLSRYAIDRVHVADDFEPIAPTE